MAGRAPYFYLREDEAVVARVRPPLTYAVVLLVAPAVALTALLVGALVARAVFAPELSPLVPAGVAGALFLLAALAAWRRAATTEYALTDERVYARTGRLVTRLHFTTHDKITDVRFRQGPIERLFGLSSLTFATAGGDVELAGIRDVLAIKGQAEAARDAFIRRLLALAPAAPAPVERAPEETGAEAPGPASAPPAIAFAGPRPDYLQAGDAPVWSEKPQLVAALGALRSMLGIIPILLFSNFMEGPRRVWIPVAALGFVMMLVAVRFMQLRRTEYVATERRVYARQGLLGTTVNQLTYDKITDITFHQDLLGRILGYGSVTLQTAGGSQAPITMIGLAKPLDAKETIEAWRDASVGGARR